MINLFQPALGEDELQVVKDVFASNWIGRGSQVKALEEAWAKQLNLSPSHIVATNCCTSALFEAVKLAEVGGMEVIIPSIHFVGAYNAIIANGGIPVFCDVNRRSLNAGPADIYPKITPRTKAILTLDYGGIPCAIHELDLPKSIKIISDSAGMPVGEIKGEAAAKWADFVTWSLDAMKVISAGDGGLLYCRSLSDAERSRKEMYLGMSVKSGFNNDVDRWWEFELEYPGSGRAIMNDITAAIGLVQLRKLRDFTNKRQEIWEAYNTQLAGVGDILIPPPLPDYVTDASYYFYWIQTSKRDELATYLKKKEVYTSFRYYPLHWAIKANVNLPFTKWAADRTLLLPCHQSLESVDPICQYVREFYR